MVGKRLLVAPFIAKKQEYGNAKITDPSEYRATNQDFKWYGLTKPWIVICQFKARFTFSVIPMW